MDRTFDDAFLGLKLTVNLSCAVFLWFALLALSYSRKNLLSVATCK